MYKHALLYVDRKMGSALMVNRDFDIFSLEKELSLTTVLLARDRLQQSSIEPLVAKI